MAKKVRYEQTTVGVLNGFKIQRTRIGAAVYWQAVKLDAYGYVYDRSAELGTRKAAEKFAQER